MTYGRQQLFWQKQVTVIGSIDFDSQIDEYHTCSVGQFRHAVCHRRSLRRQRFAPISYSLLQQMLTVGHCVNVPV